MKTIHEFSTHQLMKLVDILDRTNTIEKTSFYKVLTNLIDEGGTDEIWLCTSSSIILSEFHFQVNTTIQGLS